MEIDYFNLEPVNFRRISFCRCRIQEFAIFNKNFSYNVCKYIGVLFDSIEWMCGLDDETNINDSLFLDSYDGVSKVNFLNNIRYEGNILNGKFNGEGEIYIGDNLYYKGEFKNNLFHGKGKLNSIYFDEYEGEFINGCAYGKCNIKWRNGNSYNGNIKNNLIDGYGVYVYHDGSCYEGNFSNGMKSGAGTFTAIRNDVKVEFESSDWTYDFIFGKGSIRCFEKSFNYFGDLKTIFLNYESYLVPHGKGIIKNNNCKYTYVGYFKNGLRNGMGYEYNQYGIKMYHGNFKNNKYEGEGVIFNCSGGKAYVGKFQDGLKHGRGMEYDELGNCIYIGNFESNLYHGEGRIFNLSGKEVYNGSFSLGTRHGSGWIKCRCNYELANFKNGKKFGRCTFTDSNLRPKTEYFYDEQIVSKKFKDVTDCKDTECSICFGKFTEKQLVTKLNGCNHIFHSECIFTWFNTQETEKESCPMCRSTKNLFNENNSRKRKLEA